MNLTLSGLEEGEKAEITARESVQNLAVGLATKVALWSATNQGRGGHRSVLISAVVLFKYLSSMLESVSDSPGSGYARRSLLHKERISLRLWAFRFINCEHAESFGVTVEGYRANDPTETVLRNWHSTAIEERISSSLLRSRTGSIYELRGSIDKDLAYLYGYPTDLVSAFTDGFPENWKHLLKKFFDTVRTTVPLSTSLNFSTFDRRQSQDAPRGRIQANRVSVKSALGTSATLPDVIAEEMEDEERKSDSSEAVLTPPVMECPDSNIAVHNTDTVNSAEKYTIKSNEATFCERQDTLRQSISDGSVASVTEPLQHTVGSARSSPISIRHSPIPVVHSPISVSSQSVNQDLSAGPRYQEPSSSVDLDKCADVGRESVAAPHNALVVRSPNVVDIPASQHSRGNDNAVVELSEWSIRFAPIECGDLGLGFPAFVVLGNKEGHLTQWQTSIVTRVVSAETFYTKFTKYRLVGDINYIDSARAGFPKRFVAKFSRGFPPDWRTTITQLYDGFISHLERTASLGNVPEGDGYADSFHNADFGKKTQLQRYECDRYSQRGSGSSKQSRVSDITHSFPKQVETDVHRTRSGRCVRPPLAEWAGQRVRYDGRGNVIGIQDVANTTEGVMNISDLCSYYGVSSSYKNTRTPAESVMEVARFSGDRYPAKPPRKQPLRALNVSTDDAENRQRRKATSSARDRRGMLARDHDVDYAEESDDSSYERELRMERQLIREKARKLLDLERRIAMEEEICRRKRTTGKFSGAQVRNGWSNHSEEVTGRWNKPKGRHDQRKHGKDLTYDMDSLGEEYKEDWGEHRRHLEEMWARDNEELRSDSDYDNEEWGKPARKKKKVPAKKVRTRIPSSDGSSNERCVEDEENYPVDAERGSCSKIPVRKERGWNRAELQRLKLALAAVHVRNEEDWEKVSRSLGGERDPESCKEAAIKRLKWKPSNVSNDPEPKNTSESVTARAGTIAHHHQTSEYTRKFMMGGGVQGEDFFHHNATIMSNSIPDVTNFGAEDSLLEVIHTPENAVNNNKKGKSRRQFFAEPVDDETPPRRRSSNIHVDTPTDSAQRERRARYCHYILNKGGRGRGKPRMDFSRVGDSTYLEGTRDEEFSRNAQSFGDLHENLEKVAQITQRGVVQRTDMDDSIFHSGMDDNDLDDLTEDCF
ncbi:hypothetical protein KIN20_023686 [Parelaphostrongylus tenuis]|uniref:SANTA domain-containing protein n=1 Tax=Parelaphostrongylus tenuis TaxID=148309 RepID=A0AAD5MSA2_PARTN|nr:hypothetical protein KIN20_023686 [Parelaphostrongylus tenuis]